MLVFNKIDRIEGAQPRHDAPEGALDETTIATALTELYDAGLKPDWWKLEPMKTAAAWVAGHTVERLPDGIPVWALEIAIALLTTAFSLVISHVGATIVTVPIAVNLALAAGGNPTAFALIVVAALLMFKVESPRQIEHYQYQLAQEVGASHQDGEPEVEAAGM